MSTLGRILLDMETASTTTYRGDRSREEGLMASTHNITTGPIKASQPGALDGFEARCSCGFRATTSLSEHEARNQGLDHADYMRRAGK